VRRDIGRSATVGPVAGAALVLTLTILYAPVLQLVVSSFNQNSLTTRWQGVTAAWYRAALDNEQVRDAALRSVRLAISVAVAATVVGTAAAIAVRHRPRLRAFVLGLAAARIATPEIVLAVALSVLLPLVEVGFGPVAMWFGHVVLLSAYVVLVVSTRLVGMSALQEESAADLGASPARVVATVVVPHVVPAVAAAAVLVAAFSFDDVLLSARLSGPTDTTLPVVILSMATRRPTPELDAIGSLVVLANLAAFAVALLVHSARNGRLHDLVAPGAGTTETR
jgi:ABC-type spermidine/putrescine transport system permease subunit II